MNDDEEKEERRDEHRREEEENGRSYRHHLLLFGALVLAFGLLFEVVEIQNFRSCLATSNAVPCEWGLVPLIFICLGAVLVIVSLVVVTFRES